MELWGISGGYRSDHRCREQPYWYASIEVSTKLIEHKSLIHLLMKGTVFLNRREDRLEMEASNMPPHSRNNNG